MATPTPKRDLSDPFSRYPPRPAGPATEDVDPRWIVKALAGAIAAAILCAYLAVCLLIWIGGWQRILHPVAVIDKTPAQYGIPFETVHFDASANGKPRLTAWWLPTPNLTAPTILFLHDGSGSLSAANFHLELLRRADVNILALDYRGYGQSDGPHPTEARMNEDAAAALDYLTETRHIAATRIIPYGLGLGAVLAANLAHAHPELPALIADDPNPNTLADQANDPNARFFPMRLLLRDHFDAAAALDRVHQPKLLLANSPFGIEPPRVKANQALFRNAPDPKLTVTFDQLAGSEDAYLTALHRFLDENVR